MKFGLLTSDKHVAVIEQLGWSVNSLDDSSGALRVLIAFSQFPEVVFTEFGFTSNIFVQSCQSSDNVAKSVSNKCRSVTMPL